METNTKAGILVNGENHRINPATRLRDFLEHQKLSPERVVVEYNGQALTQYEARRILLKDGDKLEIVRIVAGG